MMLSAANQTAPANGANGLVVMVVYLLVIGLVFWFAFIRPQKKKKKEEEKLKNSLQIGDEIVTIGGFHAKIVSIQDDSLVIESVLDHSKQKIERWAIHQNLTVHDEAPAKK